MCEFKDGNRSVTVPNMEMLQSLAALKSLLESVEEGRPVSFEDLGICGNWDSDFSYFLVSHYGSQWPKSAHPGEFHPYPIRRNDEDLWEGTSRKLRIDLMKFIVSKLEQLIKEDPQ